MVKLIEFSEEHLPNSFLWIQDEDLKRNFLFRKSVTRESHKQWFDAYLKDDSQQLFAIFYQNKYVGNVGLKNIDAINKNSETWMYIGDVSMKGKGIGVEANRQLFLYAKKKLHKLYAHIAEFNNSSIRMYQKSGFVPEGNFKDQLYFEDGYHNLLRFAYFL